MAAEPTKKSRIVSALAAATLVLGGAAGLASAAATAASDHGTVTAAGEHPATQRTGTTAVHSATGDGNGNGHGNKDIDDMGWQW
jgi:Spy/CpxP family protein refolding chaperone